MKTGSDLMLENGAAQGSPGDRPCRSGLSVSVHAVEAGGPAARLRVVGTVADDLSSHPWIRQGADVVIAIEPEGTRFSGALGHVRVYEDRIEIDIAPGGDQAADLPSNLEQAAGSVLFVGTEPVTETILRVLGIEAA